MKKVPTKMDPQSGASLVELMVVALIIMIVASLAFMSGGTSNRQFQRQNVSRELKAALERARFDSVKRRAEGADLPASVEIDTDRYTLTTYTKAADGTLSANVQQITLPSGVIINHYSSGSLPMIVTFNRRGETSGGVPQFRICNVTCSSPTVATSDVLLVTPTGTVNLLAGDATIPTFTNPTLLGGTSTTDYINDDVVVP